MTKVGVKYQCSKREREGRYCLFIIFSNVKIGNFASQIRALMAKKSTEKCSARIRILGYAIRFLAGVFWQPQWPLINKEARG